MTNKKPLENRRSQTADFQGVGYDPRRPEKPGSGGAVYTTAGQGAHHLPVTCSTVISTTLKAFQKALVVFSTTSG